MLSTDRVTAPARRSFSSIQFSSHGAIAIALSGGGDSTALACLARDFFAERGELHRLIAVTVDHGLRLESADEAERAAAFCAALGISHVTRRWQGDKPAAGLQAAAREARYALLTDAVSEAGGGMVLTGHTLDDQAETVAMRAARGPGRGLSGIAPATLYRRRVWFVRPLLGLRRADLRDWLSNRGQGWIDDPSNRDRRFERVRWRGGDAAAADADDHLAAFEARRAEAQAAATILGDAALWRFDRDRRAAELATGAAARDGFALSLAVVMSWVGHGAHLPGGAVLDKALDFCAAGASGTKMTAAGCLLERTRDHVRIGREARNRRVTGHGFDHLLPSPDFAVAQALAARTGEGHLPPPPMPDFPSGYPE